MIGNGYSGCSADQFSPEMQIGAHKCASNAHGSRQRSRITQLLEAVKFEFEVLMQEVNLFKSQRNEFERVFTSQVAELNALRHSLQDLERTHQKMKKSYEDGTVIHQCRAIDGRSQQAADVGEMGCISSEIAAQRQKSMNSGMSAVGLPMGMKGAPAVPPSCDC